MRTPQLIMMAALPLLLVTACKKSDIPVLPLSSLTVVNALSTGNTLVSMFGSTTGQHFSDLVQVYNGSAQLYSQPPSINSLLIASFADTAAPLYQGKLPLVAGGIYSLFLAGDSTRPDTLLVKDNIPTISDSSIGVRFINLVQGGKAISINLVGNDPSSQTEVSSLGHLQITDFKKYIADYTIPGEYDFEVHDQASGDLLTTIYFYYTIGKNNTLVIYGSTDPAGPGVNGFPVNNY